MLLIPSGTYIGESLFKRTSAVEAAAVVVGVTVSNPNVIMLHLRFQSLV